MSFFPNIIMKRKEIQKSLLKVKEIIKERRRDIKRIMNRNVCQEVTNIYYRGEAFEGLCCPDVTYPKRTVKPYRLLLWILK